MAAPTANKYQPPRLAQHIVLRAKKDSNENEPELTKEERSKFYNNRSNVYAYAVVGTLLLLRILFQWQRKSFNYIYGFKGDGLQMNNPEFEILSAYPGLESLYGILVGFAYSVPVSICGLLVTLLPKGFNRKLTLGAVTLVAGLSMGLTGGINSLAVLALMRVLHAGCFSWVNTLVFSLSAEYFPKNKRATANAFLQSSQVFGIALSSLSIIIIQRFGWRQLYSLMGALGLGLGAFSILFIKEPCCEELETK